MRRLTSRIEAILAQAMRITIWHAIAQTPKFMSQTRPTEQEKQAKRLSEGRCPIHGLGMGQITGWFDEITKEQRNYTIVADGRKDCEFCAKAYSIDGPYEPHNETKSVVSERSLNSFWEMQLDYALESPGDSYSRYLYKKIMKWPKMRIRFQEKVELLGSRLSSAS